MKMKMRAKKVFALAMAALMIFALAACSVKDDVSAGTSADDAKNLDDAVKIYKKLMDEENKILSENQELWEKVFAAADKRDMTLQEDGKNYGDFLMDTIESAKDSFSADELKTLKEGAKRISEIENELTKLEEEYPEVREKAI
ncbi:MAG: TlpA family protein disulfide reductase, partial [Clostridia bacterium]|nr:TlpA family protein disulfide reductase [Clostridia bacterium]